MPHAGHGPAPRPPAGGHRKGRGWIPGSGALQRRIGPQDPHAGRRALGRSVRFILAPGQTGDAIQAPALGQRADPVIADAAHDGRALREAVASIGAIAAIPSNPALPASIRSPATRSSIEMRGRIERGSDKLGHARRFATGCGRKALPLLGAVHIATAMLSMR